MSGSSDGSNETSSFECVPGKYRLAKSYHRPSIIEEPDHKGSVYLRGLEHEKISTFTMPAETRVQNYSTRVATSTRCHDARQPLPMLIKRSTSNASKNKTRNEDKKFVDLTIAADHGDRRRAQPRSPFS